MREKYVEQALVKSVKARGGICPKWVSPSFSGVPDRLVFLPNGKFGLVEVKAPGGKPRLLQVSRHRLFERLGFKVHVLDSVENIGEVLDAIETT
ncbi:VRR-NUC domain-containing protein [Streptococcus agalactiae]|uniref:VRR-NUC domain-containing protein n=1 Tax=Streptococcus TaxID=1301 RepID=UPI000E4127F8|nr:MULTISPECIES: VRR-NUC domain-containing protein [Streptococcus]KAF1126900.1 nuclease [Streptococcus agalactiae]MCD0021327.1 VRR-NUC domain-containing protein [Streptococcus agalactiae]RGB48194.1 VRR-NUC domain-containing protein [Streptococcus pasteurianus]